MYVFIDMKKSELRDNLRFLKAFSIIKIIFEMELPKRKKGFKVP